VVPSLTSPFCIHLSFFLHNKYNLYKLKSLLRLVVETSSLWHYMFGSAVRISIQGGSSLWVYSVSCIGASTVFGQILRALVSLISAQ
jgi:hypothetical protein